MTQSVNQVRLDDLLKDFTSIVNECETLLKSVTDECGDNASCEKMESELTAVKDKLSHIEETVIETTKAAVRATDSYVHEYPWRAIGIAVGVGAVIGILLNRR